MNYKYFTQLVEFVDNEYNEPSKEEIVRMFKELEELIENGDGERIDDSLTQRFESGYCANPSYELSKHIVKILKLSEYSATVELDNGLTVVLYPETCS